MNDSNLGPQHFGHALGIVAGTTIDDDDLIHPVGDRIKNERKIPRFIKCGDNY